MPVITARRPRGSHVCVITAAVLAMMLSTVGPTGSAAAASPEAKLKDARQRLEEGPDRLEQVGATCERNQRRVEQVNGRVEGTLVAVGEAEAAVDDQRRVVGDAQTQLDELAVEAAEVQELSSARVVELYKQGATDPTLPTLLASSSTQEALSRAQMLSVVERSDRMALEQLQASQTAVDAQRELFAQQQHVYEQVLGEREQILADLENLRVVYELKVGRCNEKVNILERQEQIAAADEERLTAALADNGPIAVPPAASTGGWAWPARGPLTSGFGQRWGRLHAGIDIGAPTGAPIYAAKGGVVSYAGVMGGYGNIVVIDHGSGMTTRYAHQSQLGASVGQTVRPGDQIGYIGSTGNVTGPHLHFEVRINDQPQDPIGYLP